MSNTYACLVNNNSDEDDEDADEDDEDADNDDETNDDDNNAKMPPTLV